MLTTSGLLAHEKKTTIAIHFVILVHHGLGKDLHEQEQDQLEAARAADCYAAKVIIGFAGMFGIGN